MKNPKIGDKIYVGTSLSISHGSDDFHGGICTISEIDKSEKLQVNHMNYIFIGIEERPGTLYNYKILIENQEKLKERFGDKVGCTCLDIDRPWLEEGDMVNGKKYLGPSIW